MDYQPFIHGDGKYRAEESQRDDLQRKGSYSPPKTMSLVLVDRIQSFGGASGTMVSTWLPVLPQHGYLGLFNHVVDVLP